MITLEKVLSPMNMLQACKRVKANKGSPGVDGMTVDEIEGHLRRHGASIYAHIREGKYIPFPVRRVDIPVVRRHKLPTYEVRTFFWTKMA